MTIDTQLLPDAPAVLKQLLAQQMALVADQNASIAEKDMSIAELKASYQNLLEQFRLAQQRQFGKSSEVLLGQGELFNEQEQDHAEVEVQPETEAVSYTRRKPVRKPLPADLPREQVILDLADEDKTGDCCHGDLHRIGEDKSEKLEFIPAKLKVVETIRPKYACRHCDEAGKPVKVKQAPVPKHTIPKGIATPSLLSQIISNKYQYALPLYRQETMFKQHGIDLSRKTMSDWMLRCADALQGLHKRLHQQLLQQPVIHADETTVAVVNNDKATNCMWVYCSGTDAPNQDGPPNIVLYDYQPSRSGQCAVNFLDGFDGHLQVDDYAGYHQTAATLVGCWAHARRKFVEAKKAQPKNKSVKADVALSHIQKLYAIEAQAKALSTADKRLARIKRAKPQLDNFKQWLDKSAVHVPPQSALGKAIHYSLNQWPKLVRYLDDGQLNFDNNRAERTVKPFVIGRNNWLFSNTANGAASSTTLYSIIETAKANGLLPNQYLQLLFEQMPHCETEAQLNALLPWNVQLD